MTSLTFATTATPTSAATCDLDPTSFAPLFFVAAVLIITVLAFLRKRRSFKKDVWGGRPGIVVPIDCLGIDNDRLAIMCVFGAATGSILNLMLRIGITEGSDVWETAFLRIAAALGVAFLYYPYFGCLASYHRIIGALVGLSYAVAYFSLTLAVALQKCNKITTLEENVLKILPIIPTILCHLFILGKFILVLYKEIKELGIFGMRLFSHTVDEHASQQVKLIRPWLRNYVHDLVNSRPARHYSGIEFYLRKIYNPEKNFKFSTLNVSVVMICSILLYNISFELLLLGSKLLDQVRKRSDELRSDDLTNDPREILAEAILWWLGSVMAATIFSFIFCVVSFIRFMENHKNNMLRMFKGDKSFIPNNISAAQFMIGEGLRYHSYQIGYFLWGYILLLLLLSVTFFVIYVLSLDPVLNFVMNYVKGGGVYVIVAIFSWLSLRIIMLIFRDYSYSKDVISINNRNAYMVFSYFWFFIGLPMGFFSAILRILKAMAVGALMLPRIDHSVMPDGFQRLDRGFNAYICYLHVETAYRNPILRVFCQILIDETQNHPGNVHTLGINRVRKWTFSAQARSRWYLALTLARNPQLASDRKPDVQAPQPAQADRARHGDVMIEIDQFCADNTALIKDK